MSDESIPPTTQQIDLEATDGVREARLLTTPPWVRTLGKLGLEISTEGGKFPAPMLEQGPARKVELFRPESEPQSSAGQLVAKKRATRLKPPADTVLLKDRLLYLLQPSLESVF